MKYFISLLICTGIFSCSDSFIKHSLQAEKAGACNNLEEPVKVTRNINGERYEFTYCLDENFNGKEYKVERRGDSLFVRFPGVSSNEAMFKLILDIDAKPAYRRIFLGNRELEVAPSGF